MHYWLVYIGTMYTVGEARVISQSLSALTASGSGSSECVTTSTASPVTSHGGSAELVPVRDVAPAAAADTTDTNEAGASEGLFNKHAQHHGSMTFIVDFGKGAGGRDGSSGSSRDPATPLSECLPARLRRKSVQYRTEREEQDEDHNAEVSECFSCMRKTLKTRYYLRDLSLNTVKDSKTTYYLYL